MENIAKALTIAGEVLLGVFIVGVLVAFFTKGGKVSSEYNSGVDAKALAQFNAEYEAFDRDNVTFDEIISLANMACDYNQQNGENSANSIKIVVDTTDGQLVVDEDTKKGVFETSTGDKSFYSNSFAEENNAAFKYKCTECEYNEKTGKISLMVFGINCTHIYLIKTTVNPTCTDPGKTIYECKFCGDTYEETSEALGHSLDGGSVTTSPTCTKEGEKEYKCTRAGCNYSEKEVIAKTEHTWKTETTAAKCTVEGSEVTKCSVCGKEKSRTTKAALGHKLDSGTVTTEAKCTTKGKTTYKCQRDGCNYSETKEDIDALKHSFDSGTVSKKATCTQMGEKTYKCTRTGCNYSETRKEIKALGHDFNGGEKVTQKAATCTVDGYAYTKCIRCDTLNKVKINLPNYGGHSWDDGTVTTAATCTKKGVKTYKCTRTVCNCTATKTEDIAKTEHIWKTETTEAKCTVEGSIVVKCSICGEKKSTTTIAALGHDLDDGSVTTPATCTSSGKTTIRCKRSGCTYSKTTENIPALGHSLDGGSVTTSPTCTTKGKTTKKCTRSGCDYSVTEENVPALGHSFDAGVDITAATCTAGGQKKYTCTRCGYSYTENTSKLGHDWGSSKRVNNMKTELTAENCSYPKWMRNLINWLMDKKKYLIGSWGYNKKKCNRCGAVNYSAGSYENEHFNDIVDLVENSFEKIVNFLKWVIIKTPTALDDLKDFAKSIINLFKNIGKGNLSLDDVFELFGF